MGVDADVILKPGKECWQNLSSEHISSAFNSDSIFFLIIFESAVLVAPALFVKVVELDALVNVVVNNFWVGLSRDSDGLSAHKWFLCRELPIYLFKSIHGANNYIITLRKIKC